MDFLDITINYIIKWRLQRKSYITKLRAIIIKLNKTQRSVDISKFTGNSLSVIGAGTTIVGLVMAPFTFGISFGVALTGTGLSVAGSLTAGGANMVNYLISKTEIKKVLEMLENDRNLLEKIKENENVNLAKHLREYINNNREFKLVELSNALVENIFRNSEKMIENSKLALNIFVLIFNAYDMVDTMSSLRNGSKSELAKKLEEIVNEMEKEIEL
jgi:hypothetical protein